MEVWKNVGIMGGTFNPIHLGHLLMAENAYEELALDEVLFIPSGISYMKAQTDMPEASVRAAMTREAIAGNPHFRYCGLEVAKQENSYSYETIARLKECNPNTRYYFIVGADSLFMMEQWRYPEKIFGEVTVVVAFRKGYEDNSLEDVIRQLAVKYDAHIVKLPCRMMDLSSTEIRNRVAEGKSIRYMVHEKTLRYIEENQLYRSHKGMW